MGTVRATADRTIAAAPDRVYAVIADYRDGRPKLLPESFVDYRVEQGGHGAGTVVTYTLHAAKRQRPYRLAVTEPEPGRRLHEADTTSSFTQDWTVEPADGGSRVSIACAWEGAGGIGGFFERTFAPKGVKRIYAQLLDRLDGEVTPG